MFTEYNTTIGTYWLLVITYYLNKLMRFEK